MKIAFDMDNTLIQSNKAIISLYNLKYNQRVPSYIEVDWMFTQLPMITKEDITEFFSSDIFYYTATPVVGMQELVKYLYSLGHELYCCTIIDTEQGKKNKLNYLEKYFPELKPIILLQNKEVTMNKSILGKEFDFLIDDNINCLETSNVKIKILFGDYPYNKNDNIFQRARNAKELKEIIQTYNILRNLGFF